MNFELINKISPSKEEPLINYVLRNRGIDDPLHFICTSEKDINDFYKFNKADLDNGAKLIAKAAQDQVKTAIIVDADCDGLTSSALLLNFLHRLFPTWVENRIEWKFHDGKKHGLKDYADTLIEENFKLVLCPDSASNDYEEHLKLKESGCDILVLDHHEAPEISKDAVIINNQLCEYPNKALTGAGVTWQFCRYLDTLINGNTKIADDFVDLAAVGVCGDMADKRNYEVKSILDKGFAAIKNPFLSALVQKNSFSLKDTVTSVGCSFYIVPYINSMTRSGTIEENELLFKSMLEYKAFEKILSDKRGHSPGEMETIVEQALRVAFRVKKRQKDNEDSAIPMVEDYIKENHLENKRALVIALESESIKASLAGLVANKFAPRYQKPCCILQRYSDETGEYYAGSARGYIKTGILDFRKICEEYPNINFAQGHKNAFGISVPAEHIEDFSNYLEERLKDFPTEPCYFVDFLFESVRVDETAIIDLSSYNHLWGQEVEEPLIGITKLTLSPDMVTLMSKDKNPTLKITLPSGLSLIKFRSSEEEYNTLTESPCMIDLTGYAAFNDWNERGQIKISEYEILQRMMYVF